MYRDGLEVNPELAFSDGYIYGEGDLLCKKRGQLPRSTIQQDSGRCFRRRGCVFRSRLFVPVTWLQCGSQPRTVLISF